MLIPPRTVAPLPRGGAGLKPWAILCRPFGAFHYFTFSHSRECENVILEQEAQPRQVEILRRFLPGRVNSAQDTLLHFATTDRLPRFSRQGCRSHMRPHRNEDATFGRWWRGRGDKGDCQPITALFFPSPAAGLGRFEHGLLQKIREFLHYGPGSPGSNLDY